MRFGLFLEHQNPRPWVEERSEQRLLQDALDQVELADRVGVDYVWAVEHHFLEEYSHSSAPEVFLAAAAARTERIRLGHGIVQLPPAVNHPVRVAERAATLDLISNGRLELGTGESSSPAEIGGFGFDRAQKRAMWRDALEAISRMLVEEPFAGSDSEWFRMPPRNVVPKPLQRPHPPLWVACSRRETIRLAAQNGIGALTFAFLEPEEAKEWVDEYYAVLQSEECVPIGFAVNPAVAVVLPMLCHEDEAVALERGLDGARFFTYSLLHYRSGRHHPGRTDIWSRFEEESATPGFELPVLRDAIGTPEHIADLCRRYEAAGVDQVVFVMQAGRNRHEHVCESLELFGRAVVPEFARVAEERERVKEETLRSAIEAALGRRDPAREAPAGYVVDEAAEVGGRPTASRSRTLRRRSSRRRP